MTAPTPRELHDFLLTSTDGTRPGAGATWIPVGRPQGVHEALLAGGRIAHPYTGLHEHDLDGVDSATWWYRTTFTGSPGVRTTLTFACLDTVAEVWFNGQHVLAARNQHRPHAVDVVLEQSNELLLSFPPPLEAVRAEHDVQHEVDAMLERQRVVRPEDPPTPDADLLLRATRARLRKATFSWGWDFAPVVPSRGVLGPVTVGAALDVMADLHVRTLQLDPATRTCRLQVTTALTGADALALELVSPSGELVASARDVGPDVHLVLDLSDVQLWWTHDLGEPALYSLRLTAELAGEPVAEQVLRHGFRTVELDRSADPGEDARLFRFVINGLPTFSRGACWVPPSMMVGSTPDDTVRGLVQLSRDGGMTMLRVWGGGVYPPDSFFDACDELGILVWQDFMFACYDYPDPTGSLAAETALEAAHQIRRLRQHPSLAVWCGENEVQAIHQLVHGTQMPRGRGWELFHEVLPEQLAALDPDRPYWPGSPWAERDDEILNGTRDGDRHAWEVWHGNDVGAGTHVDYPSRGEARHFARYEHDSGRFISEFGIHASPELATLRRWSDGQLLDVGSTALLHRIKDTPQDKGFELMRVETGEPTTLEEYVDFSAAVQAEGLKRGVEHYRRRQPHCSGTLVWQLNDSWPGTSWSVVDYDLVPKAAYYFLQRVYQPLLASFAVDSDGLALWVTNSGQDTVPLDLTVSLSHLDSGELRSEQVSAVAKAYSSLPVWRSSGAPDPRSVAWVHEAAGRLPTNRRFFSALKDLPLRSGRVTANVLEKRDGHARVELVAEGYCYLTRLESDLPGTRFSTNYFDLRDGDRCVVDVTGLPRAARLTIARFAGPNSHVL